MTGPPEPSTRPLFTGLMDAKQEWACLPSQPSRALKPGQSGSLAQGRPSSVGSSRKAAGEASVVILERAEIYLPHCYPAATPLPSLGSADGSRGRRGGAQACFTRACSGQGWCSHIPASSLDSTGSTKAKEWSGGCLAQPLHSQSSTRALRLWHRSQQDTGCGHRWRGHR